MCQLVCSTCKDVLVSKLLDIDQGKIPPRSSKTRQRIKYVSLHSGLTGARLTELKYSAKTPGLFIDPIGVIFEARV